MQLTNQQYNSMMQEYAANDPATRLQLAKDRRDELIIDFGPLDDTPSGENGSEYCR